MTAQGHGFLSVVILLKCFKSTLAAVALVCGFLKVTERYIFLVLFLFLFLLFLKSLSKDVFIDFRDRGRAGWGGDTHTHTHKCEKH